MRRRHGASEVARYLRQRVEMGEGSLFLSGLGRDEALAAMEAAAGEDAAVPDVPSPGDPAPGPAFRPSPGADSAAGPRSAGTGAPSAAAGTPRDAPGDDLPGSYEELRRVALACTRCRLAQERTQVVFSDGVEDARLVVVGEAPGANEDATGLPFVGAAGKFLDLLLACVDLSRKDSVYIANVLKCRPPGNRNPMPDEIEACSPFLRKQLEIIAPKVLLAVGTFSAQLLTGQQKPLGRLRGEVHSYQGIPLIVTYHPAALLRNPGWTRSVWDDLQLLRAVMDR